MPCRRSSGLILKRHLGCSNACVPLEIYIGTSGRGSRMRCLSHTMCAVQAQQWTDEMNQKAPQLRTALYHGPNRSRDYSPVLLASYDVVVTTYGTMSTEFNAAPQGALYRVHWHRCDTSLSKHQDVRAWQCGYCSADHGDCHSATTTCTDVIPLKDDADRSCAALGACVHDDAWQGQRILSQVYTLLQDTVESR